MAASNEGKCLQHNVKREKAGIKLQVSADCIAIKPDTHMKKITWKDIPNTDIRL